MRFTEIDLQSEDIRWFGIDKNGYIFACTSAGTQNIPEFVCKSKEETEFLEEYFFEVLEFSTTANINVNNEDIDFLLDDINLSKKGIYSFDCIIEYIPHNDDFDTHPFWYKKLTSPKNPLHFDQLPKNIKTIMDSHRIDVDITKTDYLYVEDAYKRGG